MSNPTPRLNCRSIAWVLGLILAIGHSAAAKPLKVFILAGQSNMQGWTSVDTLGDMADDPQTAPILREMRNADGRPRVCEKVWISSIGCAGDDTTEQTGKVTAGFGAARDRIGPEFTFAIYLERLLGEPALLIKTSWGGKSLHTDFRPPSAGPRLLGDFTVEQWKKRKLDVAEESAKVQRQTGVYYRLMIGHVKKVLADIGRVVPEYDSRQGYELAGFLWFQGWNDYCDDWTYHDRRKPGGYDSYSRLLERFIRDVRKDLSSPRLPFVIGVMGVGGPKEDSRPPMSYFRQAQTAPASLPEFQGNVAVVPTAPFWDDLLDELHRRKDAAEQKAEQQVKAALQTHPNLTPAEREALREKTIAESFTPEELKRSRGISHWDCHYHGAAKIVAPIGKAFAEAMVSLLKR